MTEHTSFTVAEAFAIAAVTPRLRDSIERSFPLSPTARICEGVIFFVWA